MACGENLQKKMQEFQLSQLKIKYPKSIFQIFINIQ